MHARRPSGRYVLTGFACSRPVTAIHSGSAAQGDKHPIEGGGGLHHAAEDSGISEEKSTTATPQTRCLPPSATASTSQDGTAANREQPQQPACLSFLPAAQ